MVHSERLSVLCTRLTALGYAQHKTVRLYGEELELIADACSDGNGFVIEGIARKSGKLTRMRIPRPVVDMIEHEIEIQERAKAA